MHMSHSLQETEQNTPKWYSLFIVGQLITFLKPGVYEFDGWLQSVGTVGHRLYLSCDSFWSSADWSSWQ